MKRIMLALLAVTILSVSGCSQPSTSDAPAPTPLPTTVAAQSALHGIEWNLIRFDSMDDTRLKPERVGQYTLEFQADGKLLIRSDCNHGSGTYSRTGDAELSIGTIMLTKALCPATALQRRFIRDLGYVRSMTIKDSKLHLSLMADGGIYVFESLAQQIEGVLDRVRVSVE